MLAIIFTLIPVFGIMFMGALAHRQQLLPANTVASLNQFIYWYSLPSLLFYLMASVKLEHISIMPVWGCILGLLVSQALITLLTRCTKLGWKESLINGVTASFPNCAFMGLPIILLLYPGSDEAKAMAGIIILTPTFPFVFADVFLSLQGKKSAKASDTLKNIITSLYKNPALISSCLGMVVSLGQISIPMPILSMMEILGSASAPCALFCMGMSVASQLQAWKQSHRSGQFSFRKNIHVASLALTLFAKLFLTPVLVYVFALAMGSSGVSLATMTILSAMPAAVMCHIIAVKYSALEEGCATAVLIGTLLSVFTMPLVIVIVQGLTS